MLTTSCSPRPTPSPAPGPDLPSPDLTRTQTQTSRARAPSPDQARCSRVAMTPTDNWGGPLRRSPPPRRRRSSRAARLIRSAPRRWEQRQPPGFQRAQRAPKGRKGPRDRTHLSTRAASTRGDSLAVTRAPAYPRPRRAAFPTRRATRPPRPPPHLTSRPTARPTHPAPHPAPHPASRAPLRCPTRAARRAAPRCPKRCSSVRWRVAPTTPSCSAPTRPTWPSDTCGAKPYEGLPERRPCILILPCVAM